MGRSTLQLGLLGLVVSLGTGCLDTGTVVSGPREVTAAAQETAFLGPVPVSGPRQELCFEFDPPGQSRKAASLGAVLITTDGRRDTMLNPELDRRGESRVCLIARATTDVARARLQGTHYRGVELVSNAPPVHVTSIRWWSGH